MSSPVKRIPVELTSLVPWKALFELFEIQVGINELQTLLDFPDGTLVKFYREPKKKLKKTARPLPAKWHQKLLDAIAGKFSSQEQLRTWMEDHWNIKLRELAGDYLETLYKRIELENQQLRMGRSPSDYVPRDEENGILDLLIQQASAGDLDIGSCGKRQKHVSRWFRAAQLGYSAKAIRKGFMGKYGFAE